MPITQGGRAKGYRVWHDSELSSSSFHLHSVLPMCSFQAMGHASWRPGCVADSPGCALWVVCVGLQTQSPTLSMGMRGCVNVI